MAFLPAVVLGYYLLSLTGLHRLRLPFLIAASLLFYGRAQIAYLPLLAGSIVANYGIALLIGKFSDRSSIRNFWLWAGILANTVTLLAFKYLSAVAGSIAGSAGHSNPFSGIVAPLAISFYTFQQISFLVDVARGKVKLDGLLRYTGFVAFFPTMLAGPITLYSEIGPQLGIRPRRETALQNILIGLVVFSFGLFKKTVLADTAGLWGDPIYATVHQGSAPGFLLSWAASLCYTLQIYFDFSGYSDMAIGAARMLGIVLPLNFFSPLRSISIADVWRRWHMSLGRFAMERELGKWTEFSISALLPTFLSLLIIGIWHGANWTYAVFGAMHGMFMCVNLLYSTLTRKKRRTRKDRWLEIACYRGLTFLAFNSAEVPFRSENMSDALRVWGGMAGLHGMGWTADWGKLFSATGNGMMLPMIVAGLLIVNLLPNTEQLLTHLHPALEWKTWSKVDPARLAIEFRFSPRWILVASMAFFLGIACISRGTAKFIYFNF